MEIRGWAWKDCVSSLVSVGVWIFNKCIMFYCFNSALKVHNIVFFLFLLNGRPKLFLFCLYCTVKMEG